MKKIVLYLVLAFFVGDVALSELNAKSTHSRRAKTKRKKRGKKKATRVACYCPPKKKRRKVVRKKPARRNVIRRPIVKDVPSKTIALKKDLGPYIGGRFGVKYIFGDAALTYTDALPTNRTFRGAYHKCGLNAEVYGGMNWRVGGLSLGGEVFVEPMKVEAAFQTTLTNDTVEKTIIKHGVTYGTLFNIGVMNSDKYMPYFSLGCERMKYDFHFKDEPSAAPEGRIQKSIFGYIVGAGLRFKLSSNAFLNTTYRYSGYGKSSKINTIGTETTTIKTQPSAHKLAFGAEYQF